MTTQMTFNPMVTSNAANLFVGNSAGFTQGDALADPAIKFALRGGILSAAATTSVWGGFPVKVLIPTSGSQPGTDTLGATILQAATDADPQGITVYNQAFAGLTTPQSNAPLFTPGQSVNYYLFGSGARIPLPIDPALVTLEGEIITQTVYWDYTNNLIIGTQPGGTQTALPVKIERISLTGNLTVNYNALTGDANWATDGAIAICLI